MHCYFQVRHDMGGGRHVQYATQEALIWGALGSTWLSRAFAWGTGTERTADKDASPTEESSRTVWLCSQFMVTQMLPYLH